MTPEEQTIDDIWNVLYANDTITLEMPMADFKLFKSALSQYKHKQLKDMQDDSRLSYEVMEHADDPESDWITVTITLTAFSSKLFTTRIIS